MLRLRRLPSSVPKVLKRNIGILAPSLQKASDPIQQLFLDKIREYKSKSKDGKMVDPTPEVERERKAELEKLAVHYGCAPGTKMTDFPSFNFSDPPIEVGLASK